MKNHGIAAAFVAVFGLGIGAASVFSQEAPPAKEEPAGGEAASPSPEQQAAWMKYMTPSEAHKKMAADVGEWTAATKMWMAPDAPPADMTGKASIRMILGGRFQVMDFSGSMMGMPFEGFALTAFDNATKEYTSTWADSMGTGLFVAKGKADDKGVVTLRGDMIDPMTGKPMAMREVTYSRDADTMVMELHMKPSAEAPEFKMMEIVYTRVPPAKK
jgi:hypothetical protein